MHEVHMVRDLVTTLLEHAAKEKARKVTCVYLRMGELSELNEETIGTWFRELTKKTILEGARLSIEKGAVSGLALVSFDCE